MIVEIAREAARDLEAIADYIAADNPARAISFIAEMRGACASLAEFAERFPLVPRYERHRVRRRAFGRYLIFYRVEPDKIIVLHVLHGASDYEKVLFDN